MRALGIDTTRDFITLVLIDGDNVYEKIVTEGNKKHTALLLPAVDALLSQHEMSVRDMDVFAAVVGPGSFTGIRVGLAAANAMAYSMKKPMIEVTALSLIAYNKGNGVALIDAMHGNYYGGIVKDGRVIELNFFEDGDKIVGKRYMQEADETYSNAFAALIKEAKPSDYKDSLAPLYLRESQAEREAKK